MRAWWRRACICCIECATITALIHRHALTDHTQECLCVGGGSDCASPSCLLSVVEGRLLHSNRAIVRNAPKGRHGRPQLPSHAHVQRTLHLSGDCVTLA